MIHHRFVNRLRRLIIGEPSPFPDWVRVLGGNPQEWSLAVERAKSGPGVLVATNCGGHLPSTHLETTLAVALTLRGAKVSMLLCDRFLPACLMCNISSFGDLSAFVNEGPQSTLCQGCFDLAEPVFRSLGLDVQTLGELVPEPARRDARECATKIPVNEIGGLSMQNIAVGEHALAGALRFFARGDLPEGAQAEAVARRYLEAALLTVEATRHLFRSGRFKVACFNHGIYVPQGLVGEAARAEDVSVVNWNPAYRKGCFIFSHGDTYHHTLLEEPVSEWEDMLWSREMEDEIVDYLESRRTGARDWIWFHEKPEERLEVIQRSLGIDISKPTIGLLTNVIWDAQLHYRANAFPTMMDWVLETIRHFAQRPELQLVIRVHPAEIRGTVPSRQTVVEEIARVYGSLPPNIIVIPPESPVSTYAVMEQCNAVLIYGTKTGVELTARGIPVIVGGEAWIRNKGITLDAATPEEYFSHLDRLPPTDRLDGETTIRARKYAYHFFFRRMIPVRAMKSTGGWPPYRASVRSLDDLAPGRDPGLDIICDGILNRRPFVYDPPRGGPAIKE